MAEETRTGQFKDFCFANDNERREFRIAAWLHDCGKITTPEFIVDKGTKLEANYNRIHEIRMRFEVSLRDAEIAALTRINNGEDPITVNAQLATERSQIEDDFAFVAACNTGYQHMDNRTESRLVRIAQRTWLRYLDDRLGLSKSELDAKPKSMSNLPAREYILADKPEHLIGHTDNLFELGVNYYQYNYTFVTSTRFPFKDENSYHRNIFANTIGVRLSYGRKLKWNTSVHLLAELSIPIKTNEIAQDIDISTLHFSTNDIVRRTESMSENSKDPFLLTELYFNTQFFQGFYLNYGVKFHPFDPIALFYQKIEVTDASGQNNTVLDLRLGHEQVFFYVGLGIKLDFKQKLTQKEEIEYNRLVNRIDTICAAGFKYNVSLFIDAEESWIQDAIDDIALDMMRKYNKEKAIIYNTVQMYRWDRIAYLKELLTIATNEGFKTGVKLVRGAYIEKEVDHRSGRKRYDRDVAQV